MNDNGYEDRLMQAAGELATEIQPARDLWPGIEAAIARPAAGRRWQGMLAQAAAVLLLVGASSSLTYLAMRDGNVATLPPATALHFEPVSGSFGSQYNLGPDFQDARSDLQGRLQQALDRLEPGTRLVVENSMAAIHEAIDEMNRALDQEPDNVLLQELLLSTYRRELTLMIKVDGMASAAMRRSDI